MPRLLPPRLAGTALALAATLACSSAGGEGETTTTRAAGGETTGAPASAIPAEALPPTAGADSTALRAAADSGRILGDPAAKVWLIMVSDFQCPYCKLWHDQSFEPLRREYVTGGKVRMAYLHFPLDQHPQALPAAEASMCASAQRKFWEYQSALFGDVEAWGRPGDQSAAYDAIAGRLGLDMARFRTCTRSRVMRALVEADRDRMTRAGVQSTPSFFVGNQALAGAQPTAAFRQALDAALAGRPAGAK